MIEQLRDDMLTAEQACTKTYFNLLSPKGDVSYAEHDAAVAAYEAAVEAYEAAVAAAAAALAAYQAALADE